MTPTPPSPSRLAAYQTALKAVSARTGTPLSSLVVSFGILHELTAILPLAGVFFASRSVGLGERLVNVVPINSSSSNPTDAPATSEAGPFRADSQSWIAQKGQVWIEEGEQWVARVGRRYGWFGFDKRAKGEYSEALHKDDIEAIKGHLAGDVANAVVAYAATKALLPVRIAASLYLAPGFSRTFVEPCRQCLLRPFRKRNI